MAHVSTLTCGCTESDSLFSVFDTSTPNEYVTSLTTTDFSLPRRHPLFLGRRTRTCKSAPRHDVTGIPSKWREGRRGERGAGKYELEHVLCRARRLVGLLSLWGLPGSSGGFWVFWGRPLLVLSLFFGSLVAGSLFSRSGKLKNYRKGRPVVPCRIE